MVSADDIRRVALPLPRTEEHLIRDRVKFRVGPIVYAALSLMPSAGDMRYNWVVVRLDAIDEAEMRELVQDAWRMCVPKRVAREHFGS